MLSKVAYEFAAPLPLMGLLLTGLLFIALAGSTQSVAGPSLSPTTSTPPLPERKPSPPHDYAGVPDGLMRVPAKEVFGSVVTPAPMKPAAIGFYTHGCMAGAKQLPLTGPYWQVMRPSRDRYWGLPVLVKFVERLGREGHDRDGWPGLLVGDMAQPRGGPMINGHASHQVGLDVDIWFTPMPARVLSGAEREHMVATSMLKDPFTVDMSHWSRADMKLIWSAASDPEVARIFVHPAIKKELCEEAGSNRSWLSKVRPWWGHYAHFHVRLKCPAGMSACESQPPVPTGDGCGKQLTYWFNKLHAAERAKLEARLHPPKPAKPRPQRTLAGLPAQCRAVLTAGGNTLPLSPLKTLPVRRALASKDAAPPMPKLTVAQTNALLHKVALRETGSDRSKGSVPLPTRKPKR